MGNKPKTGPDIMKVTGPPYHVPIESTGEPVDGSSLVRVRCVACYQLMRTSVENHAQYMKAWDKARTNSNKQVRDRAISMMQTLVTGPIVCERCNPPDIVGCGGGEPRHRHRTSWADGEF